MDQILAPVIAIPAVNKVLLLDLPGRKVKIIAKTHLNAVYHQRTHKDDLDPCVAHEEGSDRRIFFNPAVNPKGGHAFIVTFLMDTRSPATMLSPLASNCSYIVNNQS